MTHKHTWRGQTQKNQVILNSIQDLQRLPLPLINNLRGRFQIKFGMTSLYNNGAFTLIELLVVVLIIGILAAVAVSQYQVAVEKSRVSTILPILKTLADAQNLYYLENNTYAKSLKELGVDIPNATIMKEESNRTVYTTPNGIHYVITNSANQVYAGTNLFQINRFIQSGKLLCYAKEDSPVAQRVCKNFAATNNLLTTNCGVIIIGESVPCKGAVMHF